MKRNQYKLGSAIVLMLVTSSVASAATDITLRERVDADGPVIRLGDVAEVVGADRQPVRALSALPLMPSPAPGAERFLRKQEIADLLLAHGYDLREIRFQGAEQVSIAAAGVVAQKREDTSGWTSSATMNRHAAILAGNTDAGHAPRLDDASAARVRDELNRIATDYLSAKTGQTGWTVKCDAAEQHLALIGAATSPMTCQGGNAPWTGRQRFVVSFNTASGAIQVPVYAEIKGPTAPVVVAVRSIARGDVLTASHFEMRDVDYLPKATDRRAAVTSIEKLIGMEARQAIQPGQVVYTDQVQSPLLVKRGDLITVSSQGSGIRVRTTARARQDGAHGELVQVESLETKQQFDARVVGPRAAAIFTASTAMPETARR